MKRQSIAMFTAVALLFSVITGCATLPSGDSINGDVSSPLITTREPETTMLFTDIVTTTSDDTTTLVSIITSTESTTVTTTTTTSTTTTQAQTTNLETTTSLSPTTESTYEFTTESETITEPPVTTEQTQTTTTETTSTVTETSVISVDSKSGFQELPPALMDIVKKYQRIYPNMSIGVGIYSLDGTSGYQYNAFQQFNGACTIKAAYALYVCDYCDKNNIDITTEKLYYTYASHHGGSGVIHDWGYNKWYTVEELLTYLLGVSDNDAMKLLTTKFSMSGFYDFIIPLGGENDRAGWNAGRASVYQRCNEWLAIYNYINSTAPNASKLRTFLTNTQYCYLAYGMQYVPPYLHKSGWCDSYSYPSAADAAIIQNETGSYLMIVMTQDYSTGGGHIDVIADLGNSIDDYFYAPGFFWQ